jgi:pimeloyl-ACP methyl ester carboxylesterase
LRRLGRTRPTLGEWGTEEGLAHLPTIAPSSANDPQYRDWFLRFQRASCGLGTIEAMYSMLSKVDLNGRLPAVAVPTLCVRRDALPTSADATRERVRKIPNARFVEVNGRDVHPWAGDVDVVIDEVERFLAGLAPAG